jgi:hypothetical protein
MRDNVQRKEALLSSGRRSVTGVNLGFVLADGRFGHEAPMSTPVPGSAAFHGGAAGRIIFRCFPKPRLRIPVHYPSFSAPGR